MDVALFACDQELFEDAFKTFARSFIAIKNDESMFSIMDIMRESMLYKLCSPSFLCLIVVFLIEEQNLTEDNYFQKALAAEVASLKKDRNYKKNVKDKASKLLVSLCNREIDLCLSCVYDQSKEIEVVVDNALHGRKRGMEPSQFSYLYVVINKWSNQFAEAMRSYEVVDNTIETIISDVTKTVKTHISNCVCLTHGYYL